MKRIRISVNLIHYFQDHRQLVKIFVKNDMQTIEHLQNRIIELFNIDKHFYLMCQNHYLPTLEDIHVLNDDDLVFVIPNLNTEETPIVKKNKQETSNEVKKTKKKKKKLTVVVNNEEFIETNNNEEEKVTKKKKKKKAKQVEEEIAENEEIMETSNVETEKPKKKKRKSKDITMEIDVAEVNKSNLENEQNEEIIHSFEKTNGTTPKNTVNETIIFRASNKFDSIFTHQNNVTPAAKQVDLELDSNSEYNFVNESRRKRRRCISPQAVLPEESGANEETNEIPRKSIVQTIQNISPTEHNELLQNLKHSPRQSYALTDMLHFKNQTSSPATSEINSILEKNSTRPVLRSTRKQLSGVGKVLEFIKTEQESEMSENNESSYPVPKRKRIRTRRRKPKNTESPVESNGHCDKSVFIPPKTIAAPKVHIKFEEDCVDRNANTVKETSNGHSFKPSMHLFEAQNDFAHSTPLNKTLENIETPRNSYVPQRISLNDINPEELPVMVETPTVNSLILFKKLKLGPDYNPIVSNCILAEIIETAKNGDELHLRIIKGHEELEDPIGGRFSCNTEDREEEEEYDYDKVHIVERNTLINPKIVELKKH